MRNYTAIYSTKAIKNIQYGFTAEDAESAVNFCRGYFSDGAFEQMIIIENPVDVEPTKGTVVWANGFEVRQ